MPEITHNKRTMLNLYSRNAGRLANMKRPRFIVNALIRTFSRKYSISLNDYIIPENGFRSFNEFFTRNLKPGLRVIENGIVSPVDGSIYSYGNIETDTNIFVKHKKFRVKELIKSDTNIFKSFIVLYLSPANYHRVHAPFDMKINEILYIPGTLKSVRESRVMKAEELYCKNERIILNGDSEFGKFSFVLVGALMVGKIKLCFTDSTQSNIKRSCCSVTSLDNPFIINKGDELGYFEFGSSVILLLDNQTFTNINFEINESIKLGQRLNT